MSLHRVTDHSDDDNDAHAFVPPEAWLVGHTGVFTRFLDRDPPPVQAEACAFLEHLATTETDEDRLASVLAILQGYTGDINNEAADAFASDLRSVDSGSGLMQRISRNRSRAIDDILLAEHGHEALDDEECERMMETSSDDEVLYGTLELPAFRGSGRAEALFRESPPPVPPPPRARPPLRPAPPSPSAVARSMSESVGRTMNAGITSVSTGLNAGLSGLNVLLGRPRSDSSTFRESPDAGNGGSTSPLGHRRDRSSSMPPAYNSPAASPRPARASTGSVLGRSPAGSPRTARRSPRLSWLSPASHRPSAKANDPQSNIGRPEWLCASCTYSHVGPEAEFLQCKLCASLRTLPSATASTVAPHPARPPAPKLSVQDLMMQQWQRALQGVISPPTLSPENGTDAPPPLPPGWIQLQDPKGRVYYQSRASKSTQWDRPTTDRCVDRSASESPGAIPSTQRGSDANIAHADTVTQ
jgi:hypothetical protein